MSAPRLLVAYSAILTAAFAFTVVSDAVARQDKEVIGELDVQRINVREADGTLRLVISNQERFPELIIGKNEYVHPTRDTAGMLFYNEEGIENGGLIWGGRMENGSARSSGSLTFDRYQQDQTVQIGGFEDGPARHSGLFVNDQPNGLAHFADGARIMAMPAGPERNAAIAAANFGGTQRAFLGRQTTGASELVLRDGSGRPRLTLSVGADGNAAITFRDEAGAVVRTVTPSAES